MHPPQGRLNFIQSQNFIPRLQKCTRVNNFNFIGTSFPLYSSIVFHWKLHVHQNQLQLQQLTSNFLALNAFALTHTTFVLRGLIPPSISVALLSRQQCIGICLWKTHVPTPLPQCLAQILYSNASCSEVTTTSCWHWWDWNRVLQMCWHVGTNGKQNVVDALAHQFNSAVHFQAICPQHIWSH